MTAPEKLQAAGGDRLSFASDIKSGNRQWGATGRYITRFTTSSHRRPESLRDLNLPCPLCKSETARSLYPQDCRFHLPASFSAQVSFRAVTDDLHRPRPTAHATDSTCPSPSSIPFQSLSKACNLFFSFLFCQTFFFFSIQRRAALYLRHCGCLNLYVSQRGTTASRLTAFSEQLTAVTKLKETVNLVLCDDLASPHIGSNPYLPRIFQRPLSPTTPGFAL